MTTLREAAQQALDALEYGHFAVADQAPHAGVMAYLEATDKLREALAQPEPKPFGYFQYSMHLDAWVQNKDEGKGVAFYTAPPQRKPLTLEIHQPNEAGSTLVTARWFVDTPHGWIGAWDREAIEYVVGDKE